MTQSLRTEQVVANAEKSVPLVTAHAVESDQLPGSRNISGDSNYSNR